MLMVPPARSSLRPGLAACIAARTLAGAARGVVITSGDGTGNTTAPADDFGFENVGIVSAFGGVYLGNGWMITANHVGAQPTTLLGVTYQPVPDTGVQLTNPSGPPPDLHVFRINGYPPLPAVVLSSATPTVGEPVHCAGRSWTREPNLTTWSASWQESPIPPLVVYRGYKSLGFAGRRWGTNLVTAAGEDVGIGNPPQTVTRSIQMLFDQNGTAHEMQAVVGDSGGSCFAKRGSTWELVGLIYANSLYPNQPANTAVFWNGNPTLPANATIAADIAHYRTQIESLTPPPPGAVPALPIAAAAAIAALIVLGARSARRVRS